MIIQAAMDAGKYIPYLCYYPGMKPFGAWGCAVVTAELQIGKATTVGFPGSPASCTIPISRDESNTNRREIQSLRKGIMELLLSEHPHGCLTCHRVELCGPARHLSPPCLGTTGCSHLSKERALRAQGHGAFPRNGDGYSAHLQQSPPAARNQRPLLGHGHEPVHRLCALCARLRRGTRGLCPDTSDALRTESHRNVPGHEPARSRAGEGSAARASTSCPPARLSSANKWDKACRDSTQYATLPVG